MKIKDINIEFIDLFNLEIIQNLQDSFAEATGVASLITKPDGTPITKPSNFCGLCKIIRETPKGKKNCANSDAYLGRQHKGGPIYQKCLSGGLWDGGASISVGEKHIANWLIGQIINDEFDESLILNYAKEIGANEDDFRKELKNVTRMPLQQFKKISDSLYVFANQLSEKAYQNFQLKMHQEYLELLVNEKTNELATANRELLLINKELHNKNKIIEEQNSELLQTLKDLKETQMQLVQADKMASLGILTAGVAHEINNPLNFISSAYYGLENYFDDFGSKNSEITSVLIDSMKLGIERISIIINGLNQFSRDNGKYDEECYVHSILDNCLTILHNQIKNKVDVKKYYSENEPVIIGNVGKLHQVFINIITNSVQAITETGEIEIRTFVDGNYFRIDISDNGKGIKEEYLKRIAEPFFTTKAPGEGTGLGLSISYAIIKEHRGAMKFESEENKGTIVKINLPIQK